ncbi:MAG TPA: ABC transporter permease [Candidatus Baltobacteraceae bacterium]
MQDVAPSIAIADTPAGARPAKKRRGLRPSVFWAIREPTPRGLAISLPAGVSVLLLGSWILLTTFGQIPAMFLPSPASVWTAFHTLMADGYGSDIVASLTRVAIGFSIAVLLSIPVGLLMGTFGTWESILAPMVGTLRYVPIPALVPLLILWLGIDEAPKIAVIALATFFYNTIMVADGVRNVPRDFVNVSYTLGANRLDVLRRVILPAAMPQIIDALRVNIAVSFNFLFIAELVAADSGMGHRMEIAQRTNSSDQMFVGLIIIIIIGFVLDRLFRVAQRRLMPWHA